MFFLLLFDFILELVVSYSFANFLPNKPHLFFNGRLELAQIKREFASYFLCFEIAIKSFPHFFDRVFNLFGVETVDFNLMFEQLVGNIRRPWEGYTYVDALFN